MAFTIKKLPTRPSGFFNDVRNRNSQDSRLQRQVSALRGWIGRVLRHGVESWQTPAARPKIWPWRGICPGTANLADAAGRAKVELHTPGRPKRRFAPLTPTSASVWRGAVMKKPN